MTALKKIIFYSLIFPFVFFLCNCSHLASAPTSETQNSSNRSSHSAQDMASENESDLGTGVAGQDQDIDSDCPDGVDDCELSAKEDSPADKEAQSKLDEALVFCEDSQTAWQNGELDNALEALDKAYAMVLEVDMYSDVQVAEWDAADRLDETERQAMLQRLAMRR